ncbi:unnamed protein product, partial [marine sediment metagenome]
MAYKHFVKAGDNYWKIGSINESTESYLNAYDIAIEGRLEYNRFGIFNQIVRGLNKIAKEGLKKRTKFSFEELHRWIDNPSRTKNLGPDHRIERHAYSIKDEKYIRDFWARKKGVGWGEKAVIEWLFHIAIDNISTAFKLSKSHYGDYTYNLIKIGIERSGLIHVDFDRASD